MSDGCKVHSALPPSELGVMAVLQHRLELFCLGRQRGQLRAAVHQLLLQEVGDGRQQTVEEEAQRLRVDWGGGGGGGECLWESRGEGGRGLYTCSVVHGCEDV